MIHHKDISVQVYVEVFGVLLISFSVLTGTLSIDFSRSRAAADYTLNFESPLPINLPELVTRNCASANIAGRTSASPKIGSYAFQFRGTDDCNASDSRISYKIADVNISIGEFTVLDYRIAPQSTTGINVGIDLKIQDKDGNISYLRDQGIYSEDAVLMHPAFQQQHSNFNNCCPLAGAPATIRTKLGKLRGKTVKQIIVAYDDNSNSQIGNFDTRIDNIRIYPKLEVRIFPFGGTIASKYRSWIRQAPAGGLNVGTTQQLANTLGTVVDGPLVTTLFLKDFSGNNIPGTNIWWNIDFESGPDGWIKEYDLNTSGWTNSTLVSTALSKSTATVPNSTKGDMNGDGKVTVTDGVAVLRCAAGLSITTGICIPTVDPDTLQKADMDCDGSVSVTDGVNVLRKAAELSVTGGCRYRHIIDFDGDKKTDLVGLSSSGSSIVWNINQNAPVSFGNVGDIPAPSDYNGDGKTDIAVFRRSDNNFYVKDQTTVHIGKPSTISGTEDVPVPGDYDGDGKGDFVLWHPSSDDKASSFYGQYGNSSFVSPIGTRYDVPVPGDYNGDGKTDFAIWEYATGNWKVKYSQVSGGTSIQDFGIFGTPDVDTPVQGDYDADGITDVAIWIPSTLSKDGKWKILGKDHLNGTFPNYTVPKAQAVPGDYNGDGRNDPAVWAGGTDDRYHVYTGGTTQYTPGDDSRTPFSMASFSQHASYPAPVITSFTANPSNINLGQSSTLTWTSSNTSKWVDGSVGGTATNFSTGDQTNGSANTQVFSNVAFTYTYTFAITCYGAGNDSNVSVSKTVAVTVNVPPPGDGGDGTITPGSGTHGGTPRYIGVGTPYTPPTIHIHIDGLPSVIDNVEYRIRIWSEGNAPRNFPSSRYGDLVGQYNNNAPYIAQAIGPGKASYSFNVAPGNYDVTISYRNNTDGYNYLIGYDNYWINYLQTSSMRFTGIRDECTGCFDHPASAYTNPTINWVGQFSVHASPWSDVSVYLMSVGGEITDHTAVVVGSGSILSVQKVKLRRLKGGLDFIKGLLANVLVKEAKAIYQNIAKWPGCATTPFYLSPSIRNYISYSADTSMLPSLVEKARQAWVNAGSNLSIGPIYNQMDDHQPDAFDNRNTISLISESQPFISVGSNNEDRLTTFKENTNSLAIANFREINNVIVEVDILLNKNQTPFLYWDPLLSNWFQNIMTHQFGIAFGLSHSNTINSDSIMYTSNGLANWIFDDHALVIDTPDPSELDWKDDVFTPTTDDKILLRNKYSTCN